MIPGKIVLSILFSLILFGCKNQTHNQVIKERIKSKILKERITELIPLLKRDERHPEEISIGILTGLNSIYTTIYSMDCDEGEYYKFDFKLNEYNIPIYLNSESYKPERFFNLNDLTIISNRFEDTGFYCDDYFYVWSRISSLNEDFKIEKTVISENNDPNEIIYKDEDKVFFRNNIKVILEEPENEL